MNMFDINPYGVRRRVIALGLFAAMTCVGVYADAHAAEAYPSKQVTVVVPFSAGGTTDALGRLVAEKLRSVLKQNVIVDNRAGASGSIGAALVARAPSDGYTLLLGSGVNAVNSAVRKNVGYDFQRDFAPLSCIAVVPDVLETTVSAPFSTVAELIAYAKAHPGKVTFATAGLGSSPHLSGELFKSMAGVDMLHVAYKGSAPALQDLIGGQVSVMFDNAPSSLPFIVSDKNKSGKLKALAVTTAKRASSLPAVPTLGEAGLPGFDSSSWFGLFAPAKTPPEVLSTLHKALAQVLNDPDVVARIKELGAIPCNDAPQEFATFIQKDVLKRVNLIKTLGLQLE